MVAGGIVSASAQAQAQFYVGGEISQIDIRNEFGGFNTAGPFFNNDVRGAMMQGLRLTFGARDVYTLGGFPITPELELFGNTGQTVVSNSFNNGNGPVTFFYTSQVETIGLGVMGWVGLGDLPNGRVEAGLGLGAQNIEFSTFDGVVAGADEGTVPYGALGLRAVFSLTDQIDLTVSARHSVSGTLDVPLSSGGPAGNIEYSNQRTEFGVGIQFFFN